MSKYTRTIKGVQVDVYDILKAWGVQNPALQHLIKKALQPGARGHKTLENDLADILVSAHRAIELEGFKSRNIEKPPQPDPRVVDVLEALHAYQVKHRKTFGLEGAWDEEIARGEKVLAAYNWSQHEPS